MIGSTADKPNTKTAALCAYAAGATGILANLFLIAMFVQLGLQAGRPEDGTPPGPTGELAGSASDLAGSLGTAFMIPVALTLSAWLPDRRLSRVVQVLGVSAMVVLTVGGPLLVLGVLAFEVETPIAMGAIVVLSLWLILINRWLRSSGALRPRAARFGEIVGAGMLAGYVVVGLGLLLPWMSWPQLVVFGVGVVVGLPAWLGIPVWFLLLGRHLGRP